MRHLCLAALAVLVSACFATTAPTPALIFRYDGAGLRTCTVRLGWTVGELVEACGEPDKIVRWVGHGDAERCLIYRTEAHTFGALQGAPVVAACTTTEGRFIPGAVEQSGVGRREIVEVFGLASMPEQGL